MNLRILFVIGTLDVGGAENHLVRIAKQLKLRGWEPEVFVMSLGGPLTAELASAGIPVHGVDCQWCKKLPRGRTLSQLVSTMLHLIHIMRTRNPAVSHFFLPGAYIFGGVASFFSKSNPRIMSRRSLNNYQQSNPTYARIERWLHPRMNLVCANSFAVLEQLEQEGVSPERLRLIYNGIEAAPSWAADHRARMRTELNIPDGAVVLVIVANLIPYKGHEDLIDALSFVAAELPAPWFVLCLGRDDGIGQRLRERAANAGVAEQVRWLGSRRDVPQILAASDIGLLTSHQEGFSNAVLEAMAAGLPMVVTDVGGNAEAVIDGETGFVVPAKDPQALAVAIRRLVNDPSRHLMGERGRERVQSYFSLETCVNAYERLYCEVLPSYRQSNEG